MNNPETVQLAHGGGGRLSRELVEAEILPRFGNESLRALPDAARLPWDAGEVVFTTDSYVVRPIEFPGGNIGHLAVHGTVNDLAVLGARPRWLSLALILEEGLPFATLRRVLDSIGAAVADCGVQIATGDTKVVERGRCEGLYINTAGLGSPLPGFRLGPDRIRPGDRVLTTGTLAEHGMAVLAAREGVGISNGPRSDTAPVHRLVTAIQPLAESVRFMRDPTRGGAAAVLNEAVERTACGIRLIEESLPLSAGARAVGEMLGLDPLHAPSEGRLLAVCAPDAVDAILAAWRALPEGAGAAEIGAVTDERGLVVMETVTGGRRLVDLPRGELLPRIC